VFGIPNKLFLLNVGLANLNPSLLLGNVKGRLAKLIKKVEIYSVFHNSTITANLFQILETFLAMSFTYTIKNFSSILVWQI